PASVPKGKTSNLTATVNSRGTCSGAVTWSATPAGGTLTPSGTTATFSSSTASTYTVSAKSNDDSARSGSATVSVTQPVSDCGIANGTVVTHSSNVTADQTWAGGGITHSVPNNIEVEATATLTIQPCAIVALPPNVSITVRGDPLGNRFATLLAAGTDDDTGIRPIHPRRRDEGVGHPARLQREVARRSAPHARAGRRELRRPVQQSRHRDGRPGLLRAARGLAQRRPPRDRSAPGGG